MRRLEITVTTLWATAVAVFLIDAAPSTFAVTTAVGGAVTLGAGILSRRTPICLASLALLFVGYVAALFSGEMSLVHAVAFPALFLGLCELTFWVLEPTGPSVPRSLLVSQIGTTMAISAGAGLLALLVVVAAYYLRSSSPWIALLGLTSLVGLAALGAQVLKRVR